MPLSIDTLRSAATRLTKARARTLIEARALGLQTVFLCHSHLDEYLVRGVVALLQEAGWRVYVDWADTQMPDRPNRETAARIKQRIVNFHYFMFLATGNSMSSRWCPWEIGYADGMKPIDQVVIIPTSDGYQTHGNEYLDLYRRVDLSDANRLGVWQPGRNDGGVLVEAL